MAWFEARGETAGNALGEMERKSASRRIRSASPTTCRKSVGGCFAFQFPILSVWAPSVFAEPKLHDQCTSFAALELNSA